MERKTDTNNNARVEIIELESDELVCFDALAMCNSEIGPGELARLRVPKLPEQKLPEQKPEK